MCGQNPLSIKYWMNSLSISVLPYNQFIGFTKTKGRPDAKLKFIVR
ncbi:MAG: hypothetical protein PWQ08_1158 [Clostridiales bacterium]|nr:hypothetical protein [Clostridiales bacterium]